MIIRPLTIMAPRPTPPGPSFDQVTIGTQTWMAKNLAIDDGGEGITTLELTNINGVNLGTQYYYTKDAAVRVANSIEGWHLPSKAEFETLKSYCGNSTSAKKLKSTTSWNSGGNGTDDYGFTGYACGEGETIGAAGGAAKFWSSTLTSNTSYSYYFYLIGGYDEAYIFNYSNTYHYSVRLIKDT